MCRTLPSTSNIGASLRRPASCSQVFEATDEALKEEDAAKERLCSELNMLVQQSAHAQLEKLEQVLPHSPPHVATQLVHAYADYLGPWPLAAWTLARPEACGASFHAL